ncbi:MAG: Uma2 family endonuclease [Pleurocapsa sp.]
MLKQQINSKEFVENIYKFFSLEQDKEQSYSCSNLTWNEYESILEALNNNSWCKVSYLDGVLTLVSPSSNHEITKGKIRALLEVYCDYAEIDYFSMGSTTLKQKDKSSGKEPDESYCFNNLKDIPDLAIEVIESSGSLEDLEKYRRLSVKEVWFWQKDQLEVYVLQSDRYVKQTSSYCLPNLNLELLANSIKQINTGNLRLLKKQFISQL